MTVQQWAQWHAEHERQLADPHGFLAITSLNFLTAEPRRFPDAPGEWSTGPAGVVVDLAEGESLVVQGVAVTGRYAFGVIGERSGINAGAGDAVIEVAKRGGFDIVRPRHPENPLRQEFRGVPAYDLGCHHLSGQPQPGHRGAGRRRLRCRRLHPGHQPGLRLHRLRHLPAAPGREPAAGRDRGRREDPVRAIG